MPVKSTRLSLTDCYALFDAQQDSLLEDLFTFLRYPSVSTDPESKANVRECATWLSAYLTASGFQVELLEGSGHPVILASWLNAGPTQPTVMFYGHYDVQPGDPVNDWLSPPFAPEVRNGEIFARGAVDNKGQCFYVISALKTLLKERDSLPINVKLVIEGEEEAGSTTISELLKSYPDKFRADHLLIVDFALRTRKKAAISAGLRGVVTFEMELTGSSVDLHSGGHGGVVYNPNHALVEMLAKVRDARGRITIPGFYDGVTPLEDRYRRKVNLDFDTAEYRAAFGAEPTGGEQEYSPAERYTIRPTFEINGIGGGYAGAGFKTVIPAKAVAKFSCRTVPGQDPTRLATLIESFFRSLLPPGISMRFAVDHSGAGYRCNLEAPVVKAAEQAVSEVMQSACEFIFVGGSVPIVGELSAVSGADAALIGYGLPTDGWHSPNEHFGLDRLRMGFVTILRIVDILSRKVAQ